MGYTPNSADIINAILQGSANVESLIRANPVNQLAPATGAYSMGSNRLTSLGTGILSTDTPTLAQLSGNQFAYVVSGCVWTADAVASTRAASMTAGTVMIKGILLTVAAVTARTFTASSDTYIDLRDNGDGTASITYTTVTNNSFSPALASGGTVTDTCRIGVITVGATNIAATGNICQGNTSVVSTAAALGSSTVAAGSNGQNPFSGGLTSNQLAVASGASFSTGGGWIQVAHSTMTYLLRYTGVSANNLTGIPTTNALAGTGTVATGDAVTQVNPVGVTDLLGNPIYPTRPFPQLIGWCSFLNAFTTTSTSTIPVPNLVAPVLIPAGPARLIKVVVTAAFIGSSAVAGTTLQIVPNIGNAAAGGTALSGASIKSSVASDGPNLTLYSFSGQLAPGSYTLQLSLNQGAAGTLTLGATFAVTSLTVELA